MDIVWAMTSFALGVCAAVAESKNIYGIREGAFGAAAAFAFICMFLYLADLFFTIRIIFPNLFSSNQNK
jgi:hypothetical protein